MPEKADPRQDQPSTFLCFDFGLARIGVAVGQSVTGSASPLEVVKRDRTTLWLRIEELLQRWQPDALIVGVPFTEEGGEQPMTDAARKFARQLTGRFGLPVHEADERHTSRAAQQRFRQRRREGAARRRDAQREDAVAAQIILEQWMHDHFAGP